MIMKFGNTEFVNPKSLILNTEKLKILGKCKNYDEILDSISKEGILTPLLVNESNIVISGNMRLSIALELNLETIPVTYVNVGESDIITILHTDVAREKTLSEKLNIYLILREKCSVSQGSRTDLNENKLHEINHFRELNPLTVHTERVIKKCLKTHSQKTIIDVVSKLERDNKNFKMTKLAEELDIEWKKPTVYGGIHYSEVIEWLSRNEYLTDEKLIIQKEFEQYINFVQTIPHL